LPQLCHVTQCLRIISIVTTIIVIIVVIIIIVVITVIIIIIIIIVIIISSSIIVIIIAAVVVIVVVIASRQRAKLMSWPLDHGCLLQFSEAPFCFCFWFWPKWSPDSRPASQRDAAARTQRPDAQASARQGVGFKV